MPSLSKRIMEHAEALPEAAPHDVGMYTQVVRESRGLSPGSGRRMGQTGRAP